MLVAMKRGVLFGDECRSGCYFLKARAFGIFGEQHVLQKRNGVLDPTEGNGVLNPNLEKVQVGNLLFVVVF